MAALLVDDRRRAGRHYAALRTHEDYERRWLPPLNLASLGAVALAALFLGSSLLTILAPARGAADPFLLTRAHEAAHCAALRDRTASCLAAPGAARTLHVLPSGGLGSRLRAVASAATLARDGGWDLAVAWPEREWGFAGAFADLFSAPVLPLGCLPGATLAPTRAACKVHEVNSAAEFAAANATGWERDASTGRERLCISTHMWLTSKERELEWFYSRLIPSAPVLADVAAFAAREGWAGAAAASCVGVHVRRADLRLGCDARDGDCAAGVPVADVLPVSRYVDAMLAVAGLPNNSSDVSGLAAAVSPPRFFLATDDAAAEAEIRAGAGSALGAPRAVAALRARTAGSALAARSTTAGLREAVADLWLLSRCPVLIGTVGSGFSQTARLMGAGFFVTVGAEFEVKS